MLLSALTPDWSGPVFRYVLEHGLPFTLLGDEDHSVADKYDVWIEKSMYGKKYMGFERSTFVIDPSGKIERVFRKVKPAEHDDLVLGALAADRNA